MESTHICIWVRKSDIFSSGFPSLQRCFRVGVDNIIIISISLYYVTIITTFSRLSKQWCHLCPSARSLPSGRDEGFGDRAGGGTANLLLLAGKWKFASFAAVSLCCF